MLHVEDLSKTGTGNCWEYSLLWIQRLGILLKVGGNVREERGGEVLWTVTVEVSINRDFGPFLLLFSFSFFEIRSHSIALAGLEITPRRPDWP